MKKLLAFFLTALIALFGIVPAAVAAGSPTSAKLIWSKPVIEYHMLDYEVNWKEILNKTFLDSQFVDNVNLLTEDMFLDGWVLDEALKVTLDQQYEDVEWCFTHKYNADERVVLVFINTNFNIVNVREGVTLENGNVLFDFRDLPQETLYMFVIFGLENIYTFNGFDNK